MLKYAQKPNFTIARFNNSHKIHILNNLLLLDMCKSNIILNV